MTTQIHCPACGNNASGHSMIFDQFPAFLFPMKEDLARTVESRDLIVNSCSNCGHIFQNKYDMNLLSKIYGTYYANYPFDANEAMAQPYRKPFSFFCELMLQSSIKTEGEKLLEIGCSNPENMLSFADMGYECTGIDPSPLASNGEQINGVRIISDYYENSVRGGHYDAIISRFNLEHITDLNTHVAKMYADLRVGGRVVLQVPNIEYYMHNHQPLFAAHEHIHYFSENSLSGLFARHGFNLVSVYSDGQPSILACFEKSNDIYPRRTLSSGIPAFAHYQQKISIRAKELQVAIKSSERVVFYGCGMALYWVLRTMHNLMPSTIAVVDDNKSLIGKHLPVFMLPVQEPSPCIFENANLIVLTLSPIYHQRVLEKIKAYSEDVTVVKIGSEEIQKQDINGAISSLI